MTIMRGFDLNAISFMAKEKAREDFNKSNKTQSDARSYSVKLQLIETVLMPLDASLTAGIHNLNKYIDKKAEELKKEYGERQVNYLSQWVDLLKNTPLRFHTQEYTHLMEFYSSKELKEMIDLIDKYNAETHMRADSYNNRINIVESKKLSQKTRAELAKTIREDIQEARNVLLKHVGFTISDFVINYISYIPAFLNTISIPDEGSALLGLSHLMQNFSRLNNNVNSVVLPFFAFIKTIHILDRNKFYPYKLGYPTNPPPLHKEFFLFEEIDKILSLESPEYKYGDVQFANFMVARSAPYGYDIMSVWLADARDIIETALKVDKKLNLISTMEMLGLSSNNVHKLYQLMHRTTHPTWANYAMTTLDANISQIKAVVSEYEGKS